MPASSNGVASNNVDSNDGVDVDTAMVALGVEAATQLGWQLEVCHDLLRHGGPAVQVGLRAALLVLQPGQPGPDPSARFLDGLGRSRRYLDARLATERRGPTSPGGAAADQGRC